MKKFKNNLKIAFATVMSMVLAVALALGVAYAPIITAKAATIYVKTISEGETWHESWSSLVESMTLKLDVDETNFYNITVTDHIQSGYFYIVIYDAESEDYVGYISPNKITGFYESKDMLLVDGHKYELTCYYADENFYSGLDAELSIEFNQSDVELVDLPSGSLSSSNLMAQFTDDDNRLWVKFTTSTAGDYSFNFQYLDASVSVYNAETGEDIYSYVDTSYYFDDGWDFKDKLIFNLDANTEYYLMIISYEPTTTKLSISKNNKTVSNITVSGAAHNIYSFSGYLYEEDFNYKIKYTNNTSETVDYYELASGGFDVPNVNFLGDTINVNGEYILKGGKQPVVSTYNDIETVTYVNVESLTDYFSYLSIVNEDDNCLIEYESADEYTYYWRIKVSETGMYGIFSEYGDSFRTNFDYYSLELVDEQNNVIKFDDSSSAFPMIADREYVLSFKYKYDTYYSYNDIVFYFHKEADSLFPDVNKNGWYHDAVTYSSGQGIMSGYSNGKFGTSDGIQRQDFLVMLARLDGVDLDEYSYNSGTFSDVASGSYYEAAVNWGYENGIVTGYQNGKFGVGDKITREQIVTFLYRYAKYAYADTSYLASAEASINRKYSDYKNVSDFAREPMLWAIEKGVINGKTSNKIVPQGNAQRCEIAQIMYNIFKNDVL